jgi:hypothetical protein
MIKGAIMRVQDVASSIYLSRPESTDLAAVLPGCDVDLVR